MRSSLLLKRAPPPSVCNSDEAGSKIAFRRAAHLFLMQVHTEEARLESGAQIEHKRLAEHRPMPWVIIATFMPSPSSRSGAA